MMTRRLESYTSPSLDIECYCSTPVKKRRWLKPPPLRGNHKMLRVHDPIARFEERIIKDDNDCWLWQGKLNGWGYAVFKIDAKSTLVHRWAYEHFKGPISEEVVLDHLCKVRRCVNPDHLRAVTNTANSQRTHCFRGHPLTDSNARILSNGYRRCRICCEQNRQLYRQQQAHQNSPAKIVLELDHLLISEVQAILTQLRQDGLITNFHIQK